LSHDKLEDLLGSTSGNGLAANPKLAAALLASDTSGFISTVLGLPGSQIFNNTNASTAPGELPCGVLGGASLWFGVQPKDSGVLLVDTIGSEIDTVLGAYAGSNLVNLTYLKCDNNGAPDHIRSRLSFNVSAQSRYYLLIDGVAGARGALKLNWVLGSGPPLVSPRNSSIRVGEALLLTAPTNAVPAPTYQWRLNNRIIPGETNATLARANLQVAQAGSYSVVISNFAGMVTNTIAQINVAAPILLSYELTSGGGGPQFRVLGPSSQGFTVQSSADLVHWLARYTNASVSGPVDLSDSANVTEPARFYRVVPWP
jgi:hypothetical protein